MIIIILTEGTYLINIKQLICILEAKIIHIHTGAMLYHLCYEATHWERGQFIEFTSSLRSEMT